VANGQIEETYNSREKDAANVFALQDAIAGEVGNVLQARLPHRATRRLCAERRMKKLIGFICRECI
jgi:hypothetical protein